MVSKSDMDLRKVVELYQEEYPKLNYAKRSSTRVRNRINFAKKTDNFLLLYRINDLPIKFHNEAQSRINDLFGPETKFAKVEGNYVKPFQAMRNSNILVEGLPYADLDEINNSVFRYAGSVFSVDIAHKVIQHYIHKLDYEVKRMWDRK